VSRHVTNPHTFSLVLGATGRLGTQVVNQALEASYHVTALVRSDSNLPFSRNQLRNPNLVIRVGSVLSRSDLDKVVEGQDAVINCVGPRPFNNNDIDVCSRSQQFITESMIHHKVRRLIVVSLQGVGDSCRPGPMQKFFGRLFAGKLLDDKEMQEKLVMKYSDQFDWTIIRPGRLFNGRITHKWRINDDLATSKISRANVACFILKELKTSSWIKQVLTINS
jgi:putative NADH-flavin reductase